MTSIEGLYVWSICFHPFIRAVHDFIETKKHIKKPKWNQSTQYDRFLVFVGMTKKNDF